MIRYTLIEERYTQRKQIRKVQATMEKEELEKKEKTIGVELTLGEVDRLLFIATWDGKRMSRWSDARDRLAKLCVKLIVAKRELKERVYEV